MRFWHSGTGMTTTILLYREGKANQADILSHLRRCDAVFVPRLSARVNLIEYSQKIFENATTFEAWTGDILQGLVAVYIGKRDSSTAYITNVSVVGDFAGQGVASSLMTRCIKWAEQNSICEVFLEVFTKNASALKLYEKFGFGIIEEKDSVMKMKRCLNGGENQ